jgi:hypothetical protein
LMAEIKWDFNYPSTTIRIHGSYECDKHSDALKVCEILNETYGVGSHWVVPLNYTKEERNGSIA